MPNAVHRYHDETKHHVHRFARSLGYLDWAAQPRPFRTFTGTRSIPLYPAPGAAATTYRPRSISYRDLYVEGASAEPISAALIGDVFRHALGLSAWKRTPDSRWSLRVNPSSGNLHPTEAYCVAGPLPGLSAHAGVYHYAADRHAFEMRCSFDADGWPVSHAESWLVALTSIHWREAWRYGERAFRYCQHDIGHAIAALRLAAALVGWRIAICADWGHRDVAALTGIDREGDYVEVEQEEPACLLLVTPGPTGALAPEPLIAAVRGGTWSGCASQLSADHVRWTFIDDIAHVTQDGRRLLATSQPIEPRIPSAAAPAWGWDPNGTSLAEHGLDARSLMLQRRSALAFDGRSSIDVHTFQHLIARLLPGPSIPWDALWWGPRIHLALFVHRVDGLAPGLYFLPREQAAIARLKEACCPDFEWQRVSDETALMRLAIGDAQGLAAHLSCDQAIAADGFFSLAMIADFDTSLDAFGPPFYRHLFWEAGVIGQVLYLEAEAAGARGTGIGCFYDDPVHDVLGLKGHAFQNLYHFTVGRPIEDRRLTTEPGYPWEADRWAKGPECPARDRIVPR